MIRLSICISILIVMLFSSFHFVYADYNQNEQVKKLNETANEILKSVKSNAPETAISKVKQLKMQLTTLKYQGLTTVEGLNSLLESVLKLERSLVHVLPRQEDWKFKAKAVVLAVDALSHREQPMWLTYEKPIIHSFKSFTNAAKNKRDREAFKYWQQFRLNTELIDAAIRVQFPSNLLEKWKAMNTFLDQRMKQTPIDYLGISRVESEMMHYLRGLFKQQIPVVATISTPDDSQSKSRTVIAYAIASFIICILGFVAYRKFQNSNMTIT